MRKLYLILFCAASLIADQLKYQKPSKEILDILNAPAPPVLAVNQTRTYASLSQLVRYPSIAEVSEPMLRIAGMRIDPRTNGLHLAPHSQSVKLVKLPEGSQQELALPPGALVSELRWSDNGDHFAFTNTTAHGIELWLGDPSTGKAHKVSGVAVNAVLGDPIDWMPDNRTILVRAVPPGTRSGTRRTESAARPPCPGERWTRYGRCHV